MRVALGLRAVVGCVDLVADDGLAPPAEGLLPARVLVGEVVDVAHLTSISARQSWARASQASERKNLQAGNG